MTTIRPLTKWDIDQVQRFASEPAIAETSKLPLPYPKDGAHVWFEKISKGIYENRQVVFAIVSESQLIGVMSINNIDRDQGTAALDYWVAKDHWRKGHATRAAKLALSYAYTVIGLSKVTSACLRRNIASRRVLEKCGFVFTAESPYAGPYKDRFGGEPMVRRHIVLSDQVVRGMRS